VTSPVQAAVDLAADPVLTRRDDLLDDRVVGARLGELLDRSWVRDRRDCARVRAKVPHGREPAGDLPRRPDGGRSLVSARMFPAAKAATQVLRARDGRGRAGCRPAVGAVRRGAQHRLLGLPAGPQARRSRPADRPVARPARRLRCPLDAERAHGLHAGEGLHRPVQGRARRDRRLRESCRAGTTAAAASPSCGQRGAASPSTTCCGCRTRSGTCPNSTWPSSRRRPVGRCTSSTGARFRKP
jgi:hypothetical protein